MSSQLMCDARKKINLHNLEKIKAYDIDQHCTPSCHKDRHLYTHFCFSPGQLTSSTITGSLLMHGEEEKQYVVNSTAVIYV